jgi:hypothetical protein
MRKKATILKLVVLGGLAIGLVVFAFSSPRITTPLVTFVGYTNDASGSRRAVFTITNQGAQALDLLMSTNMSIEAKHPLSPVNTRGVVNAALEPLNAGDVLTVSIGMPNTTVSSLRVSFSFLPARPPLMYRVKTWLHRAGLRSMDMTLPTLEAYSQVVD